MKMTTEEEKKLVLARLNNLPANMKLSLGSETPITKNELITHIKNGDKVGNKFVEIHLFYLRNIAQKFTSR